MSRMSKMQTVIRAMQNSADVDIAFASAEAEAVWAMVTAEPSNGGFNLYKNGQKTDRLWGHNGDVRHVSTFTGDVQINLRDSRGFIPINGLSKELIDKFLRAEGFSGTQSRRLTARLLDYIDGDSQRQFQGAEAPEYRLKNLPPPANAPLRHLDELRNVMDWDVAVEKIDRHRLEDMISMNNSGSSLFVNAAYPPILDHLQLTGAKTRAQQSDFSGALVNEPFPSNEARLTMTYRDENGRYHQRAVEIQRLIYDLGSPVRRRFVYERTMLEEPENINFDNSLGGDKVINYVLSPTTDNAR